LFATYPTPKKKNGKTDTLLAHKDIK